MIRLANEEDLNEINQIGKQISIDFSKKNNLQDNLTKDYVEIYVYEEGKVIKGFLQIERHFEIVDIINIAVNKDFQRNGIGNKLINYLINNSSSSKLMLEVRESNSTAIKFYIKNGFKEIYRRKKYYENEDAIIMERSF